MQRTTFTRTITALTMVLAWLPLSALCQGQFTFRNPTAPTHLGSIAGPLAGPGIWGQSLVGITADSLTPLGIPIEHQSNGKVIGPVLDVPGVVAGGSVFVQMAAWDGGIWGSDYATVPMNQFGFTDIVLVQLTGGTLPAVWPLFTLSAIVPQIPEPSTLALAILGGLSLMVSRNWQIKFEDRDPHQ